MLLENRSSKLGQVIAACEVDIYCEREIYCVLENSMNGDVSMNACAAPAQAARAAIETRILMVDVTLMKLLVLSFDNV